MSTVQIVRMSAGVPTGGQFSRTAFAGETGGDIDGSILTFTVSRAHVPSDADGESGTAALARCQTVRMGDRAAGAGLVGREQQLAALRTAAAKASSAPQVVLVAGEAGIGKSVLVEQFCLQMRDQDVPSWLGGCLELAGDPIPYAPVMHILRTMRRARLAPDSSPGSPELHQPPFSVTVDRLARDRGALYERWLEIFDAATPSGDGVLVFEDLHWADPATLDFLQFFSKCLPRGLLLVMTYRDDELGLRPGLQAFLGVIARGSGVHRIELPRLSRAQLDPLAESMKGPDAAPFDLDKVYAQSAGNPFLACELLSSPQPVLAHSTMEEILLSRARHLSRSAQDLVQLVAIFERPVTDRLLALCNGLADGQMTTDLRDLIGSGLLVIDQESEEYTFRHVLTRDAVLQRLLPGERRRVHRVVAVALEEYPETLTSPSLSAECATHWYLSGDARDALQAAVRAGGLAAEVFAWSEAAKQFTRALALSGGGQEPAHGDHQLRRDLLMQAAEANHWAGATEEAVNLAQSALVVAPDSIAQATVLERIGTYLLTLGQLEQGHPVVQRADRLVAGLPATPLTAAVATLKAAFALSSGWYQAAIEAGRYAVATAAAAQEPITEGRAKLNLGVALIESGSLEEGTELARLGQQLLTKWAGPNVRLRADGALSYALLMAGNPVDACEVALGGITLVRRYGMEPGTATVTANAILALRLIGRWSAAEQLLAEALAAENLAAGTAAYLYLDGAELDTGRGRWQDAHRYLDQAWHSARADQTPTLIAELHLMAVTLAMEQQDLSSARVHIDALNAKLGGTGLPTRTIAQQCRLALRLDAEITQLGQLAPDRPDVLGDEQRQAIVARVNAAQSSASNPEVDALAATARAEHSRCQTSADPELWQRAAEAWEKASQPYEVAYCCYRWAEAELDTLKSSRAAPHPLRKCHEIAVSLGAANLRRQSEDLARRSRISLTPTSPETQTRRASSAAQLGITPREQDVLRVLALGLSNREIAKRLYLSPRTVEVHVSNLLGKLRASNRAQAMKAASRLGLLHETDHAGPDLQG